MCKISFKKVKNMKILLVGDIVGKPGRNAFTQIINRIRSEENVDFVIANAEN